MGKVRSVDEAPRRTLGGRHRSATDRSSRNAMTHDTNGASGSATPGPHDTARGADNGHASVLPAPLRRERNESAAAVLIASANGLRKRWRQAMRAPVAIREVSDCSALEQSLASECPSVLLLDLELPGLGGISEVIRIRRLRPTARIVVLTGCPDGRECVAAFKAGAWGYSDRDIAPSLLTKALDAIQKGEIWIGRKLIPFLLEELRALSGPPPSPRAGSDGGFGRVSAREREVARLVGAGARNREIAATLGITQRTVKAHLTATFRKLGISGRLQLALVMLEQS
jgi:DNA-binding NarL/FixJ family response regulator